MRSAVGHGDYKTDYRAAGRAWTALDDSPTRTVDSRAIWMIPDNSGHCAACSTTAGCRCDSCPTCPTSHADLVLTQRLQCDSREDIGCASSSASKSITCCGVVERSNGSSEALQAFIGEEMTATIENA